MGALLSAKNERMGWKRGTLCSVTVFGEGMAFGEDAVDGKLGLACDLDSGLGRRTHVSRRILASGKK